jgi:hypothetical protein
LLARDNKTIARAISSNSVNLPGQLYPIEALSYRIIDKLIPASALVILKAQIGQRPAWSDGERHHRAR